MVGQECSLARLIADPTGMFRPKPILPPPYPGSAPPAAGFPGMIRRGVPFWIFHIRCLEIPD